MRKKILSFIVVLCTTICVGIMVYSNRVDTRENSVKAKVEVLNKKQDMEKKNISKELITMPDSYKKNKMDSIKDNIEEDKKEFFSQYYVKDEKKNGVSNSQYNNNEQENKNVSNSEKDIPVFKIAKSKIKDNLTFIDKEKLLSIGSKLSAVDYEKTKKYLENGSDEDIKSTIKLLRERLSDKDFEKVKEVAGKFINMEAVNK